MKLLNNKVTLSAWFPFAVAISILLSTTLHITLPTYQYLLGEYDGPSFYTGYIFPVFMGIALAWRLHGKFWWRFALTGCVFYTLAFLLTFLATNAVVQNMFLVSMCLAILLTVQSSWLGLKRWIELKQFS